MKLLRWGVTIGLFGLAIVLVGLNSNIASLSRDIAKLSPLVLSIIAVALLLNALMAVFRFKMISGDFGHPISFLRATAAVSGGSVGGLLFFQVAGQLIARGYVMGRESVPFASVVAVTIYERIVAAAVSGVLALAGAYLIFGHIFLDPASGGADFIKLVIGLSAVMATGAWLGFGRLAAASMARYLNRGFLWQCVRIVSLSVVVQAPMMVAYVVCAHALSPATGLAELFAASAIVMFAASLPISLAGWGIREMSAVFALGVIGVESHSALLAAITIGVGSLLSMVVLGAFSFPFMERRRVQNAAVAPSGAIDHFRLLAWIVPIVVCCLVFFQVYLPIGSGALLNVNMADPTAILGGVLFLLFCVQNRRLPKWRLPWLNAAILAMTAALTVSLLLGAASFGWTPWALVNRYSGWFVLLAYAGTGALIGNAAGREENGKPVQILLLSFAGAGASIAALEILLLMMRNLGLGSIIPLRAGSIEGFSQNHNFFAFQLLMALAATLVAARGRALRIAMLAVMVAGIWFSASRSGMIALLAVLAVSLYLGVANFRELLLSSIAVLVLAFLPFVLAVASDLMSIGSPVLVVGHPILVIDEANSAERLLSMRAAIDVFVQYPIFGGGLGFFREKIHLIAASSQVLLIHSTPLWLLAELGVVGFVIFLIPALYVLYVEFKRRGADPSGNLVILCLVIMGVMSMPADMFYQRTFWLIFGAALAWLPPALAAADKHRQGA